MYYKILFSWEMVVPADKTAVQGDAVECGFIKKPVLLPLAFVVSDY
jgi:hypothetical protein